jgi:glycosyltransferase involved in cell wall biosynthesis
LEVKYIYWFAYFNTSEPSVRYRATYALEALKKEKNIGHAIVYPGYDWKSIIKFIYTFFSALFFRKRNSIIVFQKIYKGGLYTNILKILLFFRPHLTLYDIDDAEYARLPADTLHYFMQRCAACSAGSRALVAYIKPINPNVFFLPSPVLPHNLHKKQRENMLTIGWIGYYGAHRLSLTNLFFPALLQLDFPIRIIILGVQNEAEIKEINQYFALKKNIEVETPIGLPWLEEQDIYRQISRFDIGVSPLLDTEFNRGKSAFKLKQCLSCGVPVLGSATGENQYYLKSGVNGYICHDATDYEAKIRYLYQADPHIYWNLSRNAVKTFDTYSIQYYCDLFLSFYRQNNTK